MKENAMKRVLSLLWEQAYLLIPLLLVALWGAYHVFQLRDLKDDTKRYYKELDEVTSFVSGIYLYGGAGIVVTRAAEAGEIAVCLIIFSLLIPLYLLSDHYKSTGFGEGYSRGKDEGYKKGYDKGYSDGEKNGYNEGYSDGEEHRRKEGHLGRTKYWEDTWKDL